VTRCARADSKAHGSVCKAPAAISGARQSTSGVGHACSCLLSEHGTLDVTEGTKYYHTEQKPDGVYATAIDFADPEAPSLSAVVQIPGRIQVATSTAVYTASYSGEPSVLTLSRIPWAGEASPPSAAHAWPGRSLSSIIAEGQYLYLTHAPQSGVPQGSEPHSDWTWLEVLDAQTLETVGTLDIDTRGKIERLHNGRLLISTSGALLFIDIRDPAHPTAQAAVAFSSGAAAITSNNRVYTARVREPVRSYPIDLQNLRP
jgi:hypothetical protein